MQFRTLNKIKNEEIKKLKIKKDSEDDLSTCI